MLLRLSSGWLARGRRWASIDSRDTARLKELTGRVEAARRCYETGEDSGLDDVAFDALVEELRAVEERCGVAVAERASVRLSELHRGGSGSNRQRHLFPMVSLQNTYSLDGVQRWLQQTCKKLSATRSTRFVIERKFDGVALSLLYRRAGDAWQLQSAVTRGDGEWGVQIYPQLLASFAGSLPRQFTAAVPASCQTIEVRGEAVCSWRNFDRLVAAAAKKKAPTSPRNVVAGVLNRKTTGDDEAGVLDFVAYSLHLHPAGDNAQLDQWRSMAFVAERGFSVDAAAVRVDDAEAAAGRVQQLEAQRAQAADRQRADGDYATDGLVLKVDSAAEQAQLGQTLTAPSWALAFKWKGCQAVSRIRDVALQVSRAGRVTPVALIDPVLLDGATVRRCSLHNFEFLVRHRLFVGAPVLVERVGGTIPTIVVAGDGDSDSDIADYVATLRCPCSRGSPLQCVGKDVLCAAYAGGGCAQQVAASLVHLARKEALDIEGLGPSTAERLVASGVVGSLLDLLALPAAPPHRRAAIEGLQGVRLTKLLRQIEQRLLPPPPDQAPDRLARVLLGLGVPGIGDGAAAALARQCSTAAQLLAVLDTNPSTVEHVVGPVAAASLVDYFVHSPSAQQNKSLLLILCP